MNSVLVLAVEFLLERASHPAQTVTAPIAYEDDRLICFANSLITRHGEVAVQPNRAITASELQRLMLRHRGLELNPYGATSLMIEITADKLYDLGFPTYETNVSLHIEPRK